MNEASIALMISVIITCNRYNLARRAHRVRRVCVMSEKFDGVLLRCAPHNVEVIILIART